MGCKKIDDLSVKLKKKKGPKKALNNFNKKIEKYKKSNVPSVKFPPSLVGSQTSSRPSSQATSANTSPSVLDTYVSQFGTVSFRDRVLLYIFHTEGLRARVKIMPGDGLCLYHCLYHFIEKLNLRSPNLPVPVSGRALKRLVLRFFISTPPFMFMLLIKTFRYANEHLDENISHSYQQPCRLIFAEHSYEESIAQDRVWGDDQVANLTCRLFNFEVKSYYVSGGLVRSITFGCYRLEAERPNSHVVPTGRIIHENGSHFNAIEVI